MQGSAQVALSHRAVAGILILLAGAATGLLANAAMRAARGFEMAVRTPQFALEFVRMGVAARTGLLVCMALPLLTAVLWVRVSVLGHAVPVGYPWRQIVIEGLLCLIPWAALHRTLTAGELHCGNGWIEAPADVGTFVLPNKLAAGLAPPDV